MSNQPPHQPPSPPTTSSHSPTSDAQRHPHPTAKRPMPRHLANNPYAIPKQMDWAFDRAIDMRQKYTMDLRRAIEKQWYVIIETEFPLWHPTIKAVCGKPVMVSPEHIHLTVSDAAIPYALQRGVPWDWTLTIHVFGHARPKVPAVRALGIMHCHGIAQLDAQQMLLRPGEPDAIERFAREHESQKS